jgi:ankyrin repeat protein
MAESDAPEMSAQPLIGAVRAGDAVRAGELLGQGAPIAGRDDDDWSALDWAAGRADLTIIRMLLDHGADPLAVGREQRRPYDIALAAGHLDAAGTLREAEDRAAPDSPADRAWRPYCRGYLLAELRRYPGWPDIAVPAADEVEGEDETGDVVVYLHDDLTVTSSMWPGEDVLFDAGTEEWAQFCSEELGFRVPEDMDLVPPDSPRQPG